MILGFDRSFDPVPYMQFLQDIGHIMLDGFFSQIQGARDFLIALPLRYMLENLFFSNREVGKKISPLRIFIVPYYQVAYGLPN